MASTDQTFSIKLGDKSISYEMETKKSLDLEILSMNILLYILIGVFSFQYISLPIFLGLFYIIYIRIFMANHDRMHTDHSKRLPRFLELFAEYFAVTITPYDEPYPAIKQKHIAHHVLHGPDKEVRFDSRKDPHGVFDFGFMRSLFSSLFFEEVQVYLDIQNKNFHISRLYRFLIYSPLRALYIYTFGWQSYVAVVLGIRLTSFTGWFVFSWLFHQGYFFYFGFIF